MSGAITGNQTYSRPGIFVAVVGPSGAGKDSILREANILLSGNSDVHFARRIVTREANVSEDHASVTMAEFAAMAEAGAFSIHWQANGLNYGISADVHDRLAAGSIIIANASRAISPTIKSIFPRSLIVHITASEATLAHRLAIRGREEFAEREWRLQRSKTLEQAFDADIRIENNGELEDAVHHFVSAVLALKSSKNRSKA